MDIRFDFTSTHKLLVFIQNKQKRFLHLPISYFQANTGALKDTCIRLKNSTHSYVHYENAEFYLECVFK